LRVLGRATTSTLGWRRGRRHVFGTLGLVLRTLWTTWTALLGIIGSWIRDLLRATALLGFSGRLYLGVLRLILGALGTTPLLGSVIFERGDEILNLDLKSIGATVLGEGVHGDLSDKISDTLSDINDVGHSESIWSRLKV